MDQTERTPCTYRHRGYAIEALEVEGRRMIEPDRAGVA